MRKIKHLYNKLIIWWQEVAIGGNDYTFHCYANNLGEFEPKKPTYRKNRRVKK